jgi:CxxC-x17-CxxC domain-containing protein
LQADGYPVAALQGNLSQNARDRVMDDFRNGQVPVLVATNVAARGLDVSHVAQVINLELPESPELLTHRIGRTGRMDRQGQAITLLGPEDLTKWRRLERGFTRPIRRAPWRGAKALLANGNGNGHAEAAPEATSPVATRPASQTREGVRPAARRSTAPRQEATLRRSHHARATGRPTRGSDDTAPELDGRELLRRYGRDPRRPGWVDSEHGVASAASPDSHGRAPERRSRRRHQSVCASCGQTAETTFRPDPTRPVYCDGCYHDVRETRRAAVASPTV